MKKIIFVLIILFMASQVNAQQYLWRYRTDPTDCTSLTDGKERDLCFEEDDQTLYKCVPDSGNCSGTEWKLAGGASSVGALVDLTDVNSSTAGYGRLLVNNGTTWNSINSAIIDPNNGHIGIGTTELPLDELTVNALSDSEAAQAVIRLRTSSANFANGGIIRLAEGGNDQGGYIRYDGSTNKMHLGMHDSATPGAAEDVDAITLLRADGNVGIATSAPTKKLQVTGDIYASGDITCGGTCGGAGAIELSDLTDVNSSTQGYGRIIVSNGTGWNSVDNTTIDPNTGAISVGGSNERITGTTNSEYIDFGTDGYVGVYDGDTTNLMMIGSNVGIGTTTPGYKLEVTGDAYVSGDITCGGSCGGGDGELSALSDINSSTQGSGRMLVSDGSGFNSLTVGGDLTIAGDGTATLIKSCADITGSADLCDGEDATGSGAATLVELTDVNSSTQGAGRLLVSDGGSWNSNNTMYVSPSGGNVGIGTTAPSGKLEVVGEIISGTGGTVTLGGSAGQSDDGTSNNNTYIGNSSGKYATTAAYNSALGYQSGERLTSGSRNIFFGNEAGRYNQAGQYNTYIGYAAGRGTANNDANYNLAIGYDAFREGAVTGAQYNTSIGYNSDILSDNDYSIALGYNAELSESNTALIGNPTYIYKTLLSGNVGIGTTAPTYTLDVSGSLRSSGTVSLAGSVYTFPPDDGDAGEQLQTDGSGTLTWESAGAGSGATELSELSDVNTSTAGYGRLLVNNGTTWNSVNATTIDPSTGYLLIGTTSSPEALTIEKTLADDLELEVVNNSTDEGAGSTLSVKSPNSQMKMRAYNDNNDTSPFLESRGVLQTTYSTNTDMVITAPGVAEIYFITNGIGADSSEVDMMIDNNGRVGIANTSPSTALEVTGTVTATAFSGPLTGNVTGNVSGSSGSTTGNAATATALAADPANCASSGFAGGVTAAGVAEACTTPNAGTDVTADLEEETHASEHAVSASDTVFPADPDADRYLQWDDDPGALVWAEVSGGAETNSLETTITGIADTEIFVGNGADSGTFVAMSGEATLANTGALTIADSVGVSNWNLTTPTITTSIDLPAGAVNTATEIGNDIITHAQIADSDQTDTKCIWIEYPTAADDLKSIWANKTANDFLITEIWCESDQTVPLDLQIDDGTPADVNGSDLSCTSSEAEDTSLSGDTTLAAGEELDLIIGTPSGNPTFVSVCWTGNWVD